MPRWVSGCSLNLRTKATLERKKSSATWPSWSLGVPRSGNTVRS